MIVTKMRNVEWKPLWIVGMGLFALVIVLVSWVAAVTHQNTSTTLSSPLFRFAVENHIGLMLALTIIGVVYGYVLSITSYNTLRRKSKDTKSIMEIVLLFLNAEEKKILAFLISKKGTATQADISRLEGMHRVKAFRSLQKMQEKNLIDVIPHGKVRKINLKENILNVIMEDQKIEDYVKI